jgi:hypothetical protein
VDSSFREQGSEGQKAPRSFVVSIQLFVASIFQWLSGLIRLTEEEREDAGIYLDRPGGE